MAADPARDHSGMSEMLRALALPVTDTRGVNKRQFRGMPGGKKLLFHCDRDFFRPSGYDAGGGPNRGAVLY